MSAEAVRGNIAPPFAENAPQALVWVYNNVMDGLTDVYDFAGFHSSLAMTSMAAEAGTWIMMPSRRPRIPGKSSNC